MGMDGLGILFYEFHGCGLDGHPKAIPMDVQGGLRYLFCLGFQTNSDIFEVLQTVVTQKIHKFN